MASWLRPDPQEPGADRSTLRVGLATLAIGAAWAVLAMALAPHLIRGAYAGRSIAFLNHLIDAQAGRPLDEYLARWRVFAWSGLGVVLSAGAFLAVATRSRPALLVRFGPPACAFLLARSLLWIGFAAAPMHSAYGHRIDGSPAAYATSFDLRSWSRWDSHVYVSIAQRGYELYPCDIPWEGVPIARSGMWCGDTPWLPGYPALIWLLARLGIPEMAGGVLISALFCFLTLFLLWTQFLGAQRTAKSLLVLLFAALFPGAIYFHAIYPISVAAFFILLSLHLVRTGRWVSSGLAGAAAAFTYPGAFFLGLVLPASVFHRFKDVRWPARVFRSLGVGALVASGVGLVFVVEGLFVGTWDAFSRTQGQYDVSQRMPILTLRPVMARLSELIHTDWARAGIREWAALVVPLGVVFIAAVAVLAFAFAARSARRPPAPTAVPAWSAPTGHLVIFLLVFWLVPLALPHYSLIRRHTLLLPAAPLALIFPAWALGAVTGLALLLVPVLGALYFSGYLV